MFFFRQEALQEFVLKQNRAAELHSLPDQVYILDENAFFNDARLGKKERKRLKVNTALRKSLCFCLPGTKLSVDFFRDQVGEGSNVFSAWYSISTCQRCKDTQAGPSRVAKYKLSSILDQFLTFCSELYIWSLDALWDQLGLNDVDWD